MRTFKALIVKRGEDNILTFDYRPIKDDLREFYDIIKCKTIQVVKRRYKGVDGSLTIICDDEFLLTHDVEEERILPTSILINNEKVLEEIFGNLIICRDTPNGEDFDDLDLIDALRIKATKKHYLINFKGVEISQEFRALTHSIY